MATCIGRCVAGGMAALLAAIASGFQGPPPHAHLPGGVPGGAVIASHDLFAVQANRQSKIPDWVAYSVTDYDYDKNQSASAPNWKTDTDIDAAAMLAESDFNGSNYMKVGLVDRTLLNASPHIGDADYFSHVVPQTAELHGVWSQLDHVIRQLMDDYPRVWVITGPYYEDAQAMTELPGAGNKPHRVPNGYWKVIVASRRRGVHINAFKVAQDVAAGKNWHECIASVSAIEALTGLALIPNDIGPKVDPRHGGPNGDHDTCRQCLVKMPRRAGPLQELEPPVPKAQECKYLLDCLFCDEDGDGVWEKVMELAAEGAPDE